MAMVKFDRKGIRIERSDLPRKHAECAQMGQSMGRDTPIPAHPSDSEAVVGGDMAGHQPSRIDFAMEAGLTVAIVT
jgi:hypothetical protein